MLNLSDVGWQHLRALIDLNIFLGLNVRTFARVGHGTQLICWNLSFFSMLNKIICCFWKLTRRLTWCHQIKACLFLTKDSTFIVARGLQVLRQKGIHFWLVFGWEFDTSALLVYEHNNLTFIRSSLLESFESLTLVWAYLDGGGLLWLFIKSEKLVFISVSIECSLWHCDDSSLQAESNEIFGNLIIAEFVTGGSVLLFRSEEIVSLIIDKLFESRGWEKKLVISN